MIWEELDSKLIFSNVEAHKSDDIFEQVGGAFIEGGYCKPTYVDALKTREADFPTGLDIGGLGIAIPHTDVSHVNKSGIAIARLSEPVEFIQMGTDDEPVDVQLIFMLSVKEPQTHIGKLQRIIEIIQDKTVLENLLSTSQTDKVIDIIRSKEMAIEHAA